jgi:hypothetical protein|tara:strand:- start:180 stop:716 length:537 start_codon:yes stop_codon:yes gene_type:complete
MAVTTKEYTGNGSQGGVGGAQLTFPFEYLKTEDVKVSLNGTQIATTKYTFPTASSIQFTALGSSPTSFETLTQESNGAPKTGVTILIHRRTDTDSAHAVYATGSSIRAADLNNNADQLLFFAQECSDTTNPLITDISGFQVQDSGKVEGSVVYYDISTNKFKADSTTTKLTIVDGGSF